MHKQLIFEPRHYINIAYNAVKIAVDELNSKPRKCLGFKTPCQVFFEKIGVGAPVNWR